MTRFFCKICKRVKRARNRAIDRYAGTVTHSNSTGTAFEIPIGVCGHHDQDVRRRSSNARTSNQRA
jgi:hypothetical protein